MDCILGIDTSNYTTSLAAVDAATTQLITHVRRVLPVNQGERGLRQADALFLHVDAFPGLLQQLICQIRELTGEEPNWRGLGVSVKPRPMANSYMPVFRAGEKFAETLSTILRAPLVKTSHQEGHLAAALIFDVQKIESRPFVAVHLSGGTSDVLLASKTRFGYAVHASWEGSDLHAGQFVDRVGVALGLPFPAGRHLEALAQSKGTDYPAYSLPVRVKQGQMSFSGPCAAALRLVERGVEPAFIARSVEACIATGVIKAVMYATSANGDDTSVTDCVIAGGVAANEWIRARIVHRLHIARPQVRVFFAPVEFSSDNALGVAVIAARYFN